MNSKVPKFELGTRDRDVIAFWRPVRSLQNTMLRVIFRYKLEDKTNMEKLRNSIKMFSVNQMVCYHMLLKGFNVVNNGSSYIIQKKWRPNEPRNYPHEERKIRTK